MARTSGSRGEITGPRLREVALRLFARHGYAAVSMRQIAREVGVQAGALYLYTPDKQSLLFELMREHLEALLAALAEMEAKMEASSGALARLEAFVRFHIRFHAARADAVFVAYMELRNLEPENFARIEALRRRYELALEARLREGRAAGMMAPADTRLTAMAIIGTLTGLNTWFREDGRLSLAEVEQFYVDLVGRSVGAVAAG